MLYVVLKHKNVIIHIIKRKGRKYYVETKICRQESLLDTMVHFSPLLEKGSSLEQINIITAWANPQNSVNLIKIIVCFSPEFGHRFIPLMYIFSNSNTEPYGVHVKLLYL